MDGARFEQGAMGIPVGGWDIQRLRSEDVKLCSLVVIGVNDQGEKKFLTIEDGVRESTQSWREVLLDLKARGDERAEACGWRRCAGVLVGSG